MTTFKEQSGKIGGSLFRDVIYPNCGALRPEVRTGPVFGVDTSVIDLGDGRGLAVSSDPVTLIPSLGLRESAWLSVHLLINDMATTGFPPMYAQFVLNLPPDMPGEAFRRYWEYISGFCRENGVAVTGGHTGRIEGQQSTTPGGGTMFLTAPLDDIVTSDGAEPGDVIVATKEAALTATSVLARSFPETVKNRVGQEVFERGCENFYRTSSLKDALSAAAVLKNNTELKAMHDVTEGGILGAICEMAEASGCGVRADRSRLPVGDVPGKIARIFDIDPGFCVGAGSMIIAVRKGLEERLIRHLESELIPAAVVGEMTPPSDGFKIVEDDVEKELSFDGTDPYWEAFFSALKAGWK